VPMPPCMWRLFYILWRFHDFTSAFTTVDLQSDSNDEAAVAIARIIARICYEDTSVIRRRETEYHVTVSRDHASHDVWSTPARVTSPVANINRHLSSALHGPQSPRPSWGSCGDSHDRKCYRRYSPVNGGKLRRSWDVVPCSY